MRQLTFAILAIIVGIFPIGYAISDSIEQRKIERIGLDAIAEPIYQYREVRTRGNTHYNADIKFQTQSGQPVSVLMRVSKNTLDQFAAGQPVRVRYLAAEPSKAYIVGDEDENSHFIFWAVGFFMLLLGVSGVVRYRGVASRP